nr:MbcA/ParS/Xre antitoxin family protein [Roseateles albus]
MARDTFKTEADADGWMREEHPLLDGQSPFMAAQTKAGAKRVSEILTAIKWGGAV